MALTTKGLQLTAAAVKKSPEEEEEVRLLSAYDVESSGNLRRIQVSVTGMTCAACSTSVEAALMALNGVVKASVALLQNKADITFDPASVKVWSNSLLFFLIICFTRNRGLHCVNMHVESIHLILVNIEFAKYLNVYNLLVLSCVPLFLFTYRGIDYSFFFFFSKLRFLIRNKLLNQAYQLDMKKENLQLLLLESSGLAFA